MLVAGDLTGIEEASTALDEGRLAGTRAAVGLGLLSPQAGGSRQAELQTRIAALRQGPFGARRQVCKQELWQQYHTRQGEWTL
ncbi:hypothetical protein SDC9_143314 [bioreactor metagenome]|uniref:Uncharacterized protein n=1 Tax=bioreactor metagenome TaxID=1076179 RepID=A0A645E377_9ZZZZ